MLGCAAQCVNGPFLRPNLVDVLGLPFRLRNFLESARLFLPSVNNFLRIRPRSLFNQELVPTAISSIRIHSITDLPSLLTIDLSQPFNLDL